MKNQILLLVVLVFANFNDLVAEDGEAIGAKNQNRRVNSNRQRQPRLDNAAGPTAVPVTEVNLIDSVQCRYDVLHLCPSETHNNNFAVLECFQRDSSTYGQLQPRCQRYIWMYKRNLTVDFRFENAARAICNKEVNRTGCSSSIGKKGHLVNCLIENFRTITLPSCRYFLTKMAVIVFTDYRLIEGFYDHCQSDIQRLNCSKLQLVDFSTLFANQSASTQSQTEAEAEAEAKAEANGVDLPIHQGETIRCLQMKVGSEKQTINPQCEAAIFRVSELQANDFTLDRPLYYACRDDRDRFCPDVIAGDGRVLACLLHEKTRSGFSQSCREELQRRETLIEQDVRVDKPFYEACQTALTAYKCDAGAQKVADMTIVDLSHALVCLNDAINEQDPLHAILPVCKAELNTLHRLVFAEKPLTPQIVSACAEEIQLSCQDPKYSDNVAELFHCLMEQVNTLSHQPNKQAAAQDEDKDIKHPGLSDKCFTQLRTLMREADVVEDIRVDPVLLQACQSVIKIACSDNKLDADEKSEVTHDSASLFVCLIEHLAEPVMTPICARRLMEIEYFVTRDYHLDQSLLQACRRDAREKCHAGDAKWFAEHPGKRDELDLGEVVQALEDKLNERLRNAGESRLEDGDERPVISNDFEDQHSVRRKRAPLDPAKGRQDDDDKDLAVEDMEEEMIELQHEDFVLPCLFNLMKRGQLEENCAAEVQITMRKRSSFVGLMPEVERACFFDLSRQCSGREDLATGGEMACLQENFGVLHTRCKMAVANFTKDVSVDASVDFYTYKLCGSTMRSYCKAAMAPQSAWQHALNVHVRGATVDDHETLMDCLIEHKNEPSVPRNCRVAVTHFQRMAQLESVEVSVELFVSCRDDIKSLCPDLRNAPKRDVLECLSEVWTVDYLLLHPMESGTRSNVAKVQHDSDDNSALQPRISSVCRSHLRKEFLQQEEDVELDDVLLQSCKSDIKQHCDGLDPQKDERGEIVECLKQNFANLQKSCRAVLFKRDLRDADDQTLDYGLQKTCRNMIENYCDGIDSSGILDCLKSKKDDRDFDAACYQTVVTREMMQAQDIRLNPQMMQSCRSDLPRFCGNVIQEHVTNQRELAKEIREEGAHREMLGRNQAHREKTARLFGELAIEFHGKVIHCLREQFVSNLGSKASEAAKGEQLSEACTSGLRAMMRESAVNYHLDPVLNDACDKEMQNHCAAQLENPTFLDLKRVGNVNEEDNGAGKSVSALRNGISQVEECLKQQFTTKPDRFRKSCQKEMIRLLQEARADVQVDPLLHAACSLDLLYLCDKVQRGMGQHFACLVHALETQNAQLQPQCAKALRERLDMFNAAMEHAPAESFGELAGQVIRSPRRYFLAGVLLSMILAVFVIGLSCGCLTKRRYNVVQKSK